MWNAGRELARNSADSLGYPKKVASNGRDEVYNIGLDSPVRDGLKIRVDVGQFWKIRLDIDVYARCSDGYEFSRQSGIRNRVPAESTATTLR